PMKSATETLQRQPRAGGFLASYVKHRSTVAGTWIIHFFGEASERRPWAMKRETARPLLPGAPHSPSRWPGYPLLPTRASILSHQCTWLPALVRQIDQNLRNWTENSVRLSGEKIVTHYSTPQKRALKLTTALHRM